MFGDPSALAVSLLKTLIPVEQMEDGQAFIFVVGLYRTGTHLCESLRGGLFTGVEVAKEKTAEIIDGIYSGEPPKDLPAEEPEQTEEPEVPPEFSGLGDLIDSLFDASEEDEVE